MAWHRCGRAIAGHARGRLSSWGGSGIVGEYGRLSSGGGNGIGGEYGRRWASSSRDADGGRKFVHSSRAEAEPSAVTRASEAASPDVDRAGAELREAAWPAVNLLQTARGDAGRKLYAGMTTRELLATVCNLQLVALEPLVDVSLRVLQSELMRRPLAAAPILWLLKRTTYSHFCAGEDAAEATVTLARMWELGVRGILDYGVEDALDEESCDRNCAGFLDTIRMTRSMPDGSVSFVCVKISALCPIGLLERVSDHLRWEHGRPEYKLPWREDGLPILAPESPTYHTPRAPAPLTADEERDFAGARERLRTLCRACVELSVPMLVDAEYTDIQPAIDYLTYAAEAEFNAPGEAPIVYGTMQAYLRDTPARLALALDEAARRNVSLGMKLVRGAYITRENALAASLGVQSPVHRCIEDTHRCYDSCASELLERVHERHNCGVMIATHNADSGKSAAQRAIELGLDRADPRCQFGQLKGMADSLSLALVQAGFRVSKYVTFGSVKSVIPYLVRRAEENRGFLGNTLTDRQCMRAELGRRLAYAAGLKSLS